MSMFHFYTTQQEEIRHKKFYMGEIISLSNVISVFVLFPGKFQGKLYPFVGASFKGN